MVDTASGLMANSQKIQGKHRVPIPSNIPDELKALSQWVCWRETIREDKPTKIPYQVNGQPAKSNDPRTWSSFKDALASLENGAGFHGIGFVLSPNDHFKGIDLDHCRDPETGKIEPWAREIIETINSYSEVSPSGHGIRIFTKHPGPLPAGGRKKGNFEIYESGRYLTVTGHVIPGLPAEIFEREAAVRAVHSKIFGKTQERELFRNQACSDSDEKLQLAFQSKAGDKIKRLHEGDWTGYPSQSEADLAFCSHLAFWFDKDQMLIDRAFRSSGLFREKWDRRHYSNGLTYGEEVIRKAIEGCRETYQGREPGGNNSPMGENTPPDFQASPLQFPDIMTGAAGYYAEVMSGCLEPPPHFFFMAYLTCLGSLLAGRVTLESELKPQPRLYTIILGESADDRKSTAISKTVEFFPNAVSSFPACFGVGSAEGLQRRLSTDANLLLVYDEFKAFVSKSRVDGSVLLPCVTTLFESNRYESHTKDREVSLTDVNLSLLAASTVDTYERTWDSQFTDIGLNNRLFLVPGAGRRRFAIPGRVPPSEWDTLRREVGNVLRFASTVPELTVTPDARALYESWYLNLEQSIHTKRLDTYAMRFMVLLAVNACRPEVDEETMAAVIDLMNWQLQARRLHDPIDADSTIAKVEEKIRRALRSRGPMTDHNLKRAINYRRVGLWVYQKAMNNLNTAGEIWFDKKTSTWRLT